MRTEYTQQEKVEIILKTILYEFGLEENVLLSKTRRRDIVVPRQIYQYFLEKHTKQSLNRIGHLTLRDHCTVLNAIKIVNNLNDTDRAFANRLQKLDEHIDNKLNYNEDKAFAMDKLDVIEIIKTAPNKDILISRFKEFYSIAG